MKLFSSLTCDHHGRVGIVSHQRFVCQPKKNLTKHYKRLMAYNTMVSKLD